MFTSYFAKNCKNENAVSIALFPPKWYHGKEYKKLAPTKNLLFDYKCGKIDDEMYTKIYCEEVLSQLNPQLVFEELGNDAILLCWEKSGEFCHRNIVAKWLMENLKIEVKEL